MTALIANGATIAGSLVGAACLCVIAAGLGWTLLCRARLGADRLECMLLAAGIGLGLLSYTGYALGVGGLLTAAWVRGALVVCAGASAGHLLWSSRRTARFAEPSDSRGSDIPGWVLMLACGAAAVWLCALFASLGPIIDFDGLAYHVAAPKRWIELHGMHFLPTHALTELPMGCEMLFMLLLPTAGPGACKPLMAFITLLAAAAIFALGARLESRAVGATAASLFLLWAGVDRVDTTSIEMALALYVTLATYALVRWCAESTPAGRLTWLAFVGVFAGQLNCTKLSGLLITAFLLVALFALPRPKGTPVLRRVIETLAVATLAVLSASPWYLRSWHDTGSPMYPFLYGIFGGRDWTPAASATLSTFYRYFDMPGESLTARQQVLSRLLTKIAAASGLCLLAPGPGWSRAFVVGVGTFVLVQMSLTGQVRLLLPAFPFVMIVVAWWLVRLASRWSVVGWIAAIAAMIWLVPGPVRQAVDLAPAVCDLRARQERVRHNLNTYDACLWANEHLPPTARVLFGPDTRNYYLRRDALWTHAVGQQIIVYGSLPEFQQSLRRAGITHLIYNPELYRVPAVGFEVRVGWRDREKICLEWLARRSRLLFEADRAGVYSTPADDKL